MLLFIQPTVLQDQKTDINENESKKSYYKILNSHKIFLPLENKTKVMTLIF